MNYIIVWYTWHLVTIMAFTHQQNGHSNTDDIIRVRMIKIKKIILNLLITQVKLIH